MFHVPEKKKGADFRYRFNNESAMDFPWWENPTCEHTLTIRMPKK